MSRRRRRDDSDNLSLSFLDAISCGFGAIILLLVITLLFEPATIEETAADVRGRVTALERELAELRAQSVPARSAEAAPAEPDAQLLARLRADLTRIRGQYAAADLPDPDTAESGELQTARQELTAEMRRLLANYRPPAKDTTVGGIPVDSEYIIFVIDNSGSMQSVWPSVREKLEETLEVYPRVKGIQVISSGGDFLLKSSARRWITDSPESRRRIRRAMENWPGIESNPTQGIITAINTFHATDKRISIYVFGDDFRGRMVEPVIREIERINRSDGRGNRLVRIHGVGFPTGPSSSNPAEFANFMRVLCQRSGGTFVALSDVRFAPRIEFSTPFPR